MKSTTARLLEELRTITEGSVYYTEAEYPIEPFVWEVAENGELTLDKLLQAEGFLRQVKSDDVFPQNLKFHTEKLSEEMQVEDRKQQVLIDFLQSHCQSLEVHLARKNDGPHEPETEFESFPLILAETKAEEWIGIAPEVDTDFETRLNAARLFPDYDPHAEQRIWRYAFWEIERIPPQNRADLYVRFDLESLLRSSEVPLSPISDRSITVRDSLMRNENAEALLEMAARQKAQVSKATLSLAAEIKELLVGMKLSTKQYYVPQQAVESFVMRAATSRELVLSGLLDAARFARVCQFIEFSKEADDTEDTRYTSLKSLDQLLLHNLSNLREYVVGCMSVFYLYDVGQTSDGDWVGVRTTAVWT